MEKNIKQFLDTHCKFTNDNLVNIQDNYNYENSSINEHIADFIENFPQELYTLWIIIDNDNLCILCNRFRFLNLQEVFSGKELYRHFYDVAIKYMGMGFYLVLSIDKNSKQFFFRMDGGSNGFDREGYFQLYKNMNPSVTYSEYMIDFNEMTKSIINDDIKYINL